MGEIVRVLKWRLDLDSAGMAEGVDKAATSAERLAKAAAEVGEKGTSGLKKTAAAAKEADTAFEGLGYEARQVEMYVGRLEKGSGSPLVLKRNAELAEAAFNVLTQSAQRAGQAIPEALGDRVASAIGKATTQAAGMNAELEKMGGQTPTKLDKVITALEKTEASAADAWDEFRKLGDAGEKAAAALTRMESVSGSPRELAMAAAMAQLEIDELRQSIDQARASGTQLGPAVEASLSKAASNIENANNRAAALRDTMGDMRVRGDLAAKGFEAAAGAAGSFEGMLGQLMDTGGEMSQSIAKLGFSVVALGASFKMGYTEGEKLRKVLVELGVPLPNLSDAIAEMTVDIQKWASASDQSITTGTVLKDTLFNLATGTRGMAAGLRELETPETAAIARARQHLELREKQAQAERSLTSAFSASGVSWASGYQELEKLNLALADAELRLSRAGASAKLYDVEITANGETYQKLAEQAEKWGLSIEKVAPRVAAVATELGQLAAITVDVTAAQGSAAESIEDWAQSVLEFSEAINSATLAMERQRSVINDLDIATSQWMQTQQRASNLSGQSTEFMKAAEEQFRKTGQAIYTMTIMHLDWTKATEAQIDALRRMNESLNETWDGSGAGQKALDAIAQLVDLFRAGVLSLDGFNKNFAYLEEQLDRVIKAGGDLDGSLTGVLEALRKIANQIRMGPAGARPGATPGY